LLCSIPNVSIPFQTLLKKNPFFGRKTQNNIAAKRGHFLGLNFQVYIYTVCSVKWFLACTFEVASVNDIFACLVYIL
jgi:hypothetical protein